MPVEVISFRSFQKNTLQGFLTVRLSNIGFEIKDVTLHRKNGKRWLALPAKAFTKQDGSTGWARIVDFCERRYWEAFQRQALEALDEYQRQQGEESASPAEMDNDIPF
jgi:hypothetical protein